MPKVSMTGRFTQFVASMGADRSHACVRDAYAPQFADVHHQQLQIRECTWTALELMCWGIMVRPILDILHVSLSARAGVHVLPALKHVIGC